MKSDTLCIDACLRIMGEFNVGLVIVMAIHNIFLTFLSMVTNTSVKRVTNEDIDDSIRDVITTNETALKYVLFHRWKKEATAHVSFDKIFLLCTDGVMESKESAPSSYDIFIDQMIKFYNDKQQDVETFTKSIVSVPCGADLDNIHQIKASIIDVSKRILEFKSSIDMNKDTVRLYMDTTGGPRNAAMILLVISRMMAYHGIVVEDMYYSGYTRVDGAPHQIKVHRVLDIYNLFDIVAGFEEFKLYGSAKKLNAHFKPNEIDRVEQDSHSNEEEAELNDENYNSAIHDLLAAMDSFSEAINISSRGSFENSIKRLDESLALVRSTANDTSSGKDFDQDLVELLQDPIEQSYDSLLECHRNNTPDELTYIDWCLDHDYLQQALTLFCEYVPEYAIEKGIIVYDADTFYKYYQQNQVDKDKKILQAAIKSWNRAGNTISFTKFYNTVKSNSDKSVTDTDLRSMPMRLFNTINEARANGLATIKNDGKNQVSPYIDKEIRSYITCVIKEKKRLSYIEKNSTQQKERIHSFINKETEKLFQKCESLLNQYYFSLHVQDEKYAENYTLKEWIVFLKEILKDSHKILLFNNVGSSLRRNIIADTLNKEVYQKYVSCDLDSGLITMKNSTELAYNAICNALLDNITHIHKDKQYKNLILHQLPLQDDTSIVYAEQLLSHRGRDSKETVLFNVPGVSIPHIDFESVRNTLIFIEQYFEIKKARNDSNHANKEMLCKYTTSKELHSEMRKCVELARQLSRK